MQQYFKREYHNAQAPLKSLEQQSFTKEDDKGMYVNLLHQQTALLG